MKLLTIILILTTGNLFANETKIQQVLSPVVEIKLYPSGSAGSGTVIYSKDKKTFILTSYHVVEESVLNSGEKNEVRLSVTVCFRTFLNGGRKVKEVRRWGDIVLYKQSYDLALVQVLGFETKHVAKLIPRGFRTSLFDEVYTVGNPRLTGRSYFTKGEVTGLNFKHGWATHANEAEMLSINAQIERGSSGGAIFKKLDGNYYLIGVPQAIHTMDHVHVLTWMVFAVSVETVREFFVENKICFIEDGTAPPVFKLYPLPAPIKIEFEARLDDFLKPKE